jgi:hypothetical protein
MDLSSWLGYAQSLAMLYGWLFVAAAVFALGERVFGGLFRREPPGGGSADQAKS